MDEKQNKRKNRSDDDRQNPVFLMVHKTVENNHFYCGLLLLMFMSIVTGYCSVRPEIPILYQEWDLLFRWQWLL